MKDNAATHVLMMSANPAVTLGVGTDAPVILFSRM